MKKIKRIIAGLLALSLLFLCTACMVQGEKDNKKWVLIDEKTFLVGAGGEVLQSETHYGYDSYGRINEQMYESSSSYRLYYSDFKYDERGNVVSCTISDLSSIITDCYYEYDSSNNLIKLTEKNSESTSETIYEYNEYGDKVYEKYHYKSDSYESTEIINYTPYYENNICIQSEWTRTFSDVEGTKYWLDKYSYDENGNIITEYKYIAEDDYSGDGGEKIEYNEKNYVLQYVKYYTYEQREFEEYLNSENDYNSNGNGNYIETTTESITTPLSEWGFNNIDEWGNGLVIITEYNLKEGYVVYSSAYKPSACEIRNGYYLDCDWNGQKFFPRTTQKYEVVSNDILYVVGDGNLSITSRKVDLERNFIVFKEEHYKDDGSLWWETWYVPYSLIDWDRGVEKFDGEYEYSYRYYLK